MTFDAPIPLSSLDMIAFDADDTLWINEPFYRDAETQVREILQRHVSGTDIQEKLYETEIKNLEIFGYGAKGFTISMIETAIELTGAAIPAADIQQIIDIGKGLLQNPIELLPNVQHTVQTLAEKATLMVLTKGDLLDQQAKLQRSGLGRYFDVIEVVSEKDTITYQRILQKHNIQPERFLMIGNSMRSDILPVLELGGHALYIPFHTTWIHEAVSDIPENIWKLDSVSEILTIITD